MPRQAGAKDQANHWKQHIEAWQSSGQTQQVYCKANGLSYPCFGYWRRKFRQQTQETQSEKGSGSGFVPVTSQAPRPSTGLSLAFPGGLVLRGISEDNLPLVDQLLSRLS